MFLDQTEQDWIHTNHTLKTHDTAHHHDVSRTPLLHVWHHFFDHANNAKEVGLKHSLHLLDANAFHGSQQAHTCIVDWQENTQTHRWRTLLVSPTLQYCWLNMNWYLYCLDCFLYTTRCLIDGLQVALLIIATRCQCVTTTRGCDVTPVHVKGPLGLE